MPNKKEQFFYVLYISHYIINYIIKNLIKKALFLILKSRTRLFLLNFL